MKNFFFLSIVALATATLTTTALAANATLTWNGSAGVIPDGSGFYDFNNALNWVGGVAPDGTDTITFGYTGVQKIRFTADTVLLGREGYLGVFMHNGSAGNTVTFEGKSLKFVGVPNWYGSVSGDNTSYHFTNTVIFQTTTTGNNLSFVCSNTTTDAAKPWNEWVTTTFDRVLIQNAVGGGLGGVSIAAGAGNTRNTVSILELADFYTNKGGSDPIPTSTGNLVIHTSNTLVTSIVNIDKTFGGEGANYWEFTGAIAANNAQLNLLSTLSPKCSFTMGGGSYNMLNLANGLQFNHNFNLVDYIGVSRMGILNTGMATIISNIVATRSVSAGALVNNVLFIAGLDSSTLIYSGKLTGASFIGGELQFQGNGYIFLRGNTANGNVPIGRFSGGTIGLANGTASVVLGGNFSYDGPMKVYNGAGLTNQEGVMNFTNTAVNAGVTVNPQVAGFDMSLMNTNGKLVFKLETPATTYQIQATLLNIGSLDSYEFFFLRGTGFGEGEYTLFSSPNAITSTFLDTLPFFLDQAQTWQGQLAWGADNKSILLNVVAVPEPATWLLLGASLLVVTLLRKKKVS